MKLTRRSALKGSALALTASAFAGCLGEPDDSDSGSEGAAGYAAFFALWDWSQHVSGEHIAIENPVDAGEMGHGWSPDGDLTRDVASSDVYVYLDTPEFSWAQDIAAQLEDEHEDVAVIDGLEGFASDQLLPFSSGELPTPDSDHEFDSDLSVEEFDVIDPSSGDAAAYWHDGHWHGGVPDIPYERSITLEAVFEADGGKVIPLGEDEEFQFDARLDDDAPEGVLEIESHGDSVELHGEEKSQTLIVFELKRDGEVIWDTSEDTMTARVVEPDAVEATEFHDPHVWADPVLAMDIVDTIADGFSDLDPDNADEYESNADEYNQRLAAVDEAFEEAVADAELDIGVFAGHDSFQYVEHRYDFELHSPVGVSPDESPGSSAIAETIELVNEHGIETILYDPFEAPDGEAPPLAETIVDDSDATDVAPLTPAEGTLPEWNDEGWGWVEQMEEVTIPSLRKALKAP